MTDNSNLSLIDPAQSAAANLPTIQFSPSTKECYDGSRAYPGGVPDDCIAVTDAQFSEILAARETGGTLSVVGGVLVITPYAGPTLAEAQAAQNALLNTACAAAIVAGFAGRSATGAAVDLTLSQNDQSNGQAAFSATMAASQMAGAWAAKTAYPANAMVKNTAGQIYVAMVGGTSGAEEPAWPTAFQQGVTDGTVTWMLFGWLLGTTTGNQWFDAADILTLFAQAGQYVNAMRATYSALAAEVNAATTIAAVQAIVWPSAPAA